MDVHPFSYVGARRRFRDSTLGFFVYMGVSVLALGAILMFVIWPRPSSENVVLEQIELAGHASAAANVK